MAPAVRSAVVVTPYAVLILELTIAHIQLVQYFNLGSLINSKALLQISVNYASTLCLFNTSSGPKTGLGLELTCIIL